ncbi:hypothetical protein HQN90_35980 [Paenibacillus alba]|uniref:hypothetical protein n=1 Tax=Paenibacillus alba TaxID=1197127 RepID=UPI0015653C88|nr:hypothetical protein [Paenibacillus alba]NQX71499.1 hypothetical protein [Paenibacillus alba]
MCSLPPAASGSGELARTSGANSWRVARRRRGGWVALCGGVGAKRASAKRPVVGGCEAADCQCEVALSSECEADG